MNFFSYKKMNKNTFEYYIHWYILTKKTKFKKKIASVSLL